MTSQNCSQFFKDFITSTGKNVILCENICVNKLKCYNSKIHTICEYDMTNSINYSEYWENMKINKNQFHIFNNHIGINKFTININKRF
jgi:hypothetical protein